MHWAHVIQYSGSTSNSCGGRPMYLACTRRSSQRTGRGHHERSLLTSYTLQPSHSTEVVDGHEQQVVEYLQVDIMRGNPRKGHRNGASARGGTVTSRNTCVVCPQNKSLGVWERDALLLQYCSAAFARHIIFCHGANSRPAGIRSSTAY